MGHKTLINGTAYDIKGGRTLIEGTGYSIKSGKTLIGGTGYNITFTKPEELLDEMFSTMTCQASDSSSSTEKTVSIPAVTNSYYIMGGHYGSASGEGYYLGLYYYTGASETYPLWYIGSRVALNSDGSTVSSPTSQRGHLVARVSFAVNDPVARLSMLTLWTTWSAGDSSTDMIYCVVYNNGYIKPLPTYHIFAGAFGLTIGKYSGGYGRKVVKTFLRSNTGYFVVGKTGTQYRLRVSDNDDDSDGTKTRGLLASFCLPTT